MIGRAGKQARSTHFGPAHSGYGTKRARLIWSISILASFQPTQLSSYGLWAKTLKNVKKNLILQIHHSSNKNK